MKSNIQLVVLFALISLSAKAQNILGVDVSHNNGTVNWTQVAAAGKDFAYALATDGTKTDLSFQTNMANGKTANVVMGAYHFAEPSLSNGTAQAQYFLSVADSYIGKGFLPPVLDIEVTSGLPTAALSAWVKDWLTEVQQKTGISPVVYASVRFSNYSLNNSVNIYEVWVAEWSNTTSVPTSLGFWSTWIFKQYSKTGTVPGINGPVNLDVFNGDAMKFKKLHQLSRKIFTDKNSKVK